MCHKVNLLLIYRVALLVVGFPLSRFLWLCFASWIVSPFLRLTLSQFAAQHCFLYSKTLFAFEKSCFEDNKLNNNIVYLILSILSLSILYSTFIPLRPCTIVLTIIRQRARVFYEQRGAAKKLTIAHRKRGRVYF